MISIEYMQHEQWTYLAHKAWLRQGDELVSVDGSPTSGKNYEQGVKRESAGLREVSVNRVARDKLMKGPADHGAYKDKPAP